MSYITRAVCHITCILLVFLCIFIAEKNLVMVMVYREYSAILCCRKMVYRNNTVISTTH